MAIKDANNNKNVEYWIVVSVLRNLMYLSFNSL